MSTTTKNRVELLADALCQQRSRQRPLTDEERRTVRVLALARLLVRTVEEWGDAPAELAAHACLLSQSMQMLESELMPHVLARADRAVEALEWAACS